MVAMVVHSAESQDEMKSVNQQRQHDVRAFFLSYEPLLVPLSVPSDAKIDGTYSTQSIIGA